MTSNQDLGLAAAKGSATATILVVDDEEILRWTMVEELADRGYTMLEATHAEEALRLLRTRTDIDAVITDVRMPGPLDGIDLARILEADYPHIRVIVASAHVPEEALPVPVDGFLRKPFALADLSRRVGVLLQQAR